MSSNDPGFISECVRLPLGRQGLWWCSGAVALAMVLPSQVEAQYQDLSRKSGWAGSVASDINASNAGWYYNWWHTRPSGDANAIGDWMPLIKYTNNLANKLNIVAGYSDVDTLLFLNEPERQDQSNVSVAEAVSLWPQVEAALPNHRLVSPAVSDNQVGRAWLNDFMTQANANDFGVDAVAFHWYGSDNPNNPAGAANNFLNRVESYHNTYNLPVWITEFAMHDWAGNFTTAAMEEANRQFLEIVIPELEARDYVEAYSFYQWFDDARLINGNPATPTSIGNVYTGAALPGDTRTLNADVFDTDRNYLRGGNFAYSGAGRDLSNGTVDAIDGVSGLTGSGTWSLNNGGFLRVRSGARLERRDTGVTILNNTELILDGVLAIDGGEIRLMPDTVVSGDSQGLIEVNAQGVLGLGDPIPTGESVIFDRSIRLNGGTIRAYREAPMLNGDIEIAATSTFDGSGSLTIFGDITGTHPNAGLTKAGVGTLLLRGNNTYLGPTVVERGDLFLGANASLLSREIRVDAEGVLDARSLPSGLVLNGASLQVDGRFLGNVDARSDATVIVNGFDGIGGDLGLTSSTLLINGVISGNLTSAGGVVSPGGTDSMGFGIVSGITQFDAASRMVIDLEAVEADRLTSGFILLDGELSLQATPDSDPGDDLPIGTSHEIVMAGNVIGTFDTVTGAVLGPDKTIAVIYDTDRVTVTVTYTGDANADGIVGLLDLDAVGANWGSTDAHWSDGDFNYDGVINLLDLNILGAKWGLGGTASMDFAAALAASGIAVPEPTALMLATSALPLMLRRRRSAHLGKSIQ